MRVPPSDGAAMPFYSPGLGDLFGGGLPPTITHLRTICHFWRVKLILLVPEQSEQMVPELSNLAIVVGQNRGFVGAPPL